MKIKGKHNWLCSITRCAQGGKLLQTGLYAGALFLLATARCFGQAGNINNPVLPGVADAGVIKYNGEYYAGGVFTNGGFYMSKDLMKWKGPVHVFSMDNEWTSGPSADDSQIHASDITYINGVFHQFWSVNYWGKDRNAVHIGHATSPSILGPFKEPVKDTWVDNRIDPKLFADDDGKLYLYMVKFTDGNTIWARPMKDPWTFSGDPTYLFASLPNTWETLDNRVAEGPWVMKYRGRYYMMYNANHTSTGYGNYALGVAEAASPLGFNHGNKYPYPLMESNQVALESSAVDVLKWSGDNQGVFQYTFTRPKEQWATTTDVDGWLTGKGGFGSTVIKNSTTRRIATGWSSPQIWVRKAFNADKQHTGNLMLRITHDGPTAVFLNGQSIYEGTGRAYTTRNLDEKARRLIKDGENILAVESNAGSRSGYLDVSLFDLKAGTGDDILFSPGQPNILPGPNGFEWWLIYMANKNGDRRGQYINRVHFFDKRMFAEGVTGSNTTGYHPAPAAATFSDLFNENDNWQNRWNLLGGTWATGNKELLQTSSTAAKALVKSFPATHFLFQSGIKITGRATTGAGIIAWWKDEKNWLRISLHPQSKSWAYTIAQAGKQQTASFPLPQDFTFNAYHTLTVYKNSTRFTIKLDDLPAPVSPVINTNFTGKGLPGLFSAGGKAAFDGVLYTVGWDEYDTTISGWKAETAANKEDAWQVTGRGITSPRKAGEYAVFKGDDLDTYEFTTQVTWKDKDGSAGIYPVYTDKNNYLKAMFDVGKQRLIVSGRKAGSAIATKEIALEGYTALHTDMKYTDFFEKHFTLHTPAMINSVRLNKTPYGKPDTAIAGIFEKMVLSYKLNDKWYPVNGYKQVASTHPGFETISFQPVEAEALKLVNKIPDDQGWYTNKIWVNEVFRRSYNIRVAKLKDKIIFMVDGKEVLSMNHDFPASKVGLATNNTQADFNGITLFHVPGSNR